MKTLVVIKGQLRTWHESKELLKNYISDVVKTLKLQGTEEKFFKTPKVDILVSCWDISYQLYPGPHEISYLKKETVDAEEVQAFFKGCDVVDRVYFNKECLLNAHKYFLDINFFLDEEYHLQCFLTYKTGLKKRLIEARSGTDYDLVIELRPDVFYEYTMASKCLRLPGFGAIQTLNGNISREIHGIISPMTEDLIFFMGAKTYNIFCKEILFHYRNFKMNQSYTTAHVEKSLFYMANNLQINDMLHGLCSMAVILRPTLDWRRLFSIENKVELATYIRHIDGNWRGDKDRALESLLKKGWNLDELIKHEVAMKTENFKKILELY